MKYSSKFKDYSQSICYWESYLESIKELIDTGELDMPRFIITVNNPIQTLAVYGLDEEDARSRVRHIMKGLGWYEKDREIVKIERIIIDGKGGKK